MVPHKLNWIKLSVAAIEIDLQGCLLPDLLTSVPFTIADHTSRHHKRLRTIIQELYGWVSSVDLHQSSYRYDLALEGNRILSKSYR